MYVLLEYTAEQVVWLTVFRDDCSIRVYRSVSYTRVQKSDQAIAALAGAVPLALLSFRFISKISIL